MTSNKKIKKVKEPHTDNFFLFLTNKGHKMDRCKDHKPLFAADFTRDSRKVDRPVKTIKLLKKKAVFHVRRLLSMEFSVTPTSSYGSQV